MRRNRPLSSAGLPCPRLHRQLTSHTAADFPAKGTTWASFRARLGHVVPSSQVYIATNRYDVHFKRTATTWPSICWSHGSALATDGTMQRPPDRITSRFQRRTKANQGHGEGTGTQLECSSFILASRSPPGGNVLGPAVAWKRASSPGMWF